MAVCKCVDCGGDFIAGRSDAKRCDDCWVKHRRAIYQRYEKLHTLPCPKCGKPGHRRSELCAECRWKARSEGQTGPRNPGWKGGRIVSKAGYVYLRQNDGDGERAYIAEHKLVWEQAHGPLPKGYVVHHLNGNKRDNRLENLAGMPRHQHHKEPREALRPYEARIRELEAEVERLRK